MEEIEGWTMCECLKTVAREKDESTTDWSMEIAPRDRTGLPEKKEKKNLAAEDPVRPTS